MIEADHYPWYTAVNEPALLQGDIIENCPVFRVPADLDPESDETEISFERLDVIVMSQSCDIEQDKIDAILLCPIWKLSEFTTGHLATAKGKEDARQGNLPAYHLLDKCSIPGHIADFRIVEFRKTHSLPLDFLRNEVAGKPRLRLLPPYREHMAQAFARYFMRVGLPINIPSFR